jgi:uncharacterized protein YndB with AHSA1/START domain/pimeloyl-ACP methyl ester carboxylesterase
MIPRWWGPRDYTTTVDKMDLRPGGVWRFVNGAPGGKLFGFNGVYREIVRPERIVQTFEFEGTPGHIAVETVTFEEHEGRTRVTVRSLFETKEDRDGMVASGMEEGAKKSMERLDELLGGEATVTKDDTGGGGMRDGPTGVVTSEDGTRIAFDRSGGGPAVILVGGAFQHRAIDQRTTRLAALLSQHFTVFHYDRRGRGDSGDTMPYSVQREIEDLEALIEGAGGSAYVFGMSSGAVLALRAAARGLEIKRLALYEPPFNSGDAGAHRASEGYTGQLTDLLSEGRRGDAVAFAMMTFGAPAGAIAGLRQTPIWPAFESVAPTLTYDDAIMGDGSVPTGLLESVAVPVLVVDGGESPAFMHDAARAVADSLPNAQRRTLQGQTHDVDPEVLAPVLAGFFNST